MTTTKRPSFSSTKNPITTATDAANDAKWRPFLNLLFMSVLLVSGSSCGKLVIIDGKRPPVKEETIKPIQSTKPSNEISSADAVNTGSEGAAPSSSPQIDPPKTQECDPSEFKETFSAAFSKEKAPFGEQCADFAVVQKLTCKPSGELLKEPADLFSNCSVENSDSPDSSPNPDTLLTSGACGPVPHGGKIQETKYQNPAGAPGLGCVSEIISKVCENGTLVQESARAGYAFDTCTDSSALSCGALPNGGTQTRKMYREQIVSDISRCVSEQQTRTCSNAQLSDWSGSFTAFSCGVDLVLAGNPSCDGKPIGFTQTETGFEDESIPFGQQCVQTSRQRRCENGGWSQWSGPYVFNTCQPGGAASCVTIGGATMASGLNETRTMFASSSAPFGRSCVAENQQRTCSNGTWSSWSGTYASSTCSEGAAATCDGKASGTSESRIRYQSSTVPFGSTCSSVSQNQTRTCSNGTWSSWSGTYAATSCTVSTTPTCSQVTVIDVENQNRAIASASTSSCSAAVTACGQAFLTSYAKTSSDYFTCVVDGKNKVYEWDPPGYYFGQVRNSVQGINGTPVFGNLGEPITISTTTGLWQTVTSPTPAPTSCTQTGISPQLAAPPGPYQNCQGGVIPRTDYYPAQQDAWSGCCFRLKRVCAVTGYSTLNTMTCEL